MKQIYLDNAATTPVDPRVVEAMTPYWNQIYGNPSSNHSAGQAALDAVEQARERAAALFHVESEEIIFTGSGTEADNTALIGVGHALRGKGKHLITSAIEHKAILETAKYMQEIGWEVTILPVDKDGLVNSDDFKKAIRPDTVLASIMHANNEIGTIQPIGELSRIAKEHGIVFHTDAVQSAGHVEIDFHKLEMDYLSLSAHKLYGPKGVGVLIQKKGAPFAPFMHGGSHEKSRRASTHNVPGIVGLGMACDLAKKQMVDDEGRIQSLREFFWRKLRDQIDGVHLNGHPVKRLANNLNVSFDHVDGEALLMNLDMEGISVSSGSACSAKSGGASHVLTALGLPKERLSSNIRFSLGRSVTLEDIEDTVDILTRIINRLRSLSSFGE